MPEGERMPEKGEGHQKRGEDVGRRKDIRKGGEDAGRRKDAKSGRVSEGRRVSKSETPFGPLLRAYMVSAAKEA